MQWVAVVSGVVELVLSFVLGVGVAYLGFRLFARMTRDLDEVKELSENNVAVGVLLGSVLLACGLVVREALYPTISSVQTALFQGGGLGVMARTMGLGVLYVVATLVVAVLAIAVAVRLFLRFTRDIDEIDEIRRNNLAVALTLGAVIVVMALFLSAGVRSLLSALIPYPALERIQVLGGP